MRKTKRKKYLFHSVNLCLAYFCKKDLMKIRFIKLFLYIFFTYFLICSDLKK